MRDQLIEISNQFRFLSSAKKNNEDRGDAYWMQIYQPLGEETRVTVTGARQLCPWAMSAEVTDSATLRERRLQILEALKSGQKTMRLYGLPPNRIMFMENNINKQITVWVD